MHRTPEVRQDDKKLAPNSVGYLGAAAVSPGPFRDPAIVQPAPFIGTRGFLSVAPGHGVSGSWVPTWHEDLSRAGTQAARRV